MSRRRKKKELTPEPAAPAAETVERNAPVGGEVISAETVGRVEEGEPIGPSAADEAAMVGSADLPAVPAETKAPPAHAKRLPSLDSLLERIPAATRSAIDEHLRARFMRVRRLNPGELR